MTDKLALAERVEAATLLTLAKRCGMDIYALNTGVIRSDDGKGRIASSSALEPMWGDHGMLQWMPESTPGKWFYAHFSADKMELFGRQLIARAEYLRSHGSGGEG